MCKHGTDRTVTIQQTITVDACIADLVVRLNDQGVRTVNSCCGHGKGPGAILIQPSSAQRARELGYTVEYPEGVDYPSIPLLPRNVVDDATICARCNQPRSAHFTSTTIPGHWCDRNRLLYLLRPVTTASEPTKQ